MSLEKKSIHVRLDPEIHAQLSVLADFHSKDLATIASELLAKEVVGAFYDFSLLQERITRIGKMRDLEGRPKKSLIHALKELIDKEEL